MNMDKQYYTQVREGNQEIEKKIDEIQKKCIEYLKEYPCIQRKRVVKEELYFL